MTSPPPASGACRDLLGDGSFRIEWEPPLLPLLEPWLPLRTGDGGRGEAPPALIRVGARGGDPEPEGAERVGVSREGALERSRGGASGRWRPDRPPDLGLGGVDAWVEPGGETVVARARSGAVRARIDLTGLQAHVVTRLPEDDRRGGPAPTWGPLGDALTVAAAFLLGRQGRALIHSAAAVSPAGDAWLLAGDRRSGKSTTCATLMAAGWSYASDDQVVLERTASDRPAAMGWPRPFHLDPGWWRGEPEGRRRTVDPGRLGGGWVGRAAVAGVLLPRVDGGSETRLAPASPAEILAALIRQCPWFMADPSAARRGLDLLEAVAGLGGHWLLLGTDTFGDPEALTEVLAPAWPEAGV